MLEHPNIIKVHDLGVSASGPFMILEYLKGRTVAQVLQTEGPLSLERFLRIYIQVCDALEHAHSRGVLHRDLKPSNIMLTRNFNNEEEIRIMDFGIAKLIDDSANESFADKLTRTGEAIGSPAYMSPEQAQGTKVDARSDLYSLGCVMYESLTGGPPFTKSTALETIMAHLSEQPLSLSQAMLGTTKFSQDLETIVARLLKKNPDLRYQSMKELKDHLLALCDGSDLGRFVYRVQNPKKRKAILISLAMLALVATLIVLFVIATYFDAPNRKLSHALGLGRKLASAPVDSGIGLDPEKLIEAAVDNNDTEMIIGCEGLTSDSDLAPLQHATAAVKISLRLADINGTGLKYLENIHTLKSLDLCRSKVTNLRYLRNLPSLENLGLELTSVGDSELEPIRNLHLTSIELSSTSVRTLEALKDMQSLRDIKLVDDIHIGSSAMAVLGQLKNLQQLDLQGTPITDADLQFLAHLPKLKSIELLHCPNLTDSAVHNLQKKLPPDCVVHFTFGLPAHAQPVQQPATKSAKQLHADAASADILMKMAKADRLTENHHWRDAITQYKLVLQKLEAEPENHWDSIATCYSNIGLYSHVLHLNEEALNSFKKAIAVRETHPEVKSHKDLPETYFHTGVIYDSLHRKQEAILMHKRAQELFISMRSVASTTDSSEDQRTAMHRWDMWEAANLFALYVEYQTIPPTLESDRLSRPILERGLYIWSSDPASTSLNAAYYHHALADLYMRDALRSADSSKKMVEYKLAMEQLAQTLKIYGNTKDRAAVKADTFIAHSQIADIELDFKHYDNAEEISKEQLSSGPKFWRKRSLKRLIAICLAQHREVEAKTYQSELAKLPDN